MIETVHIIGGGLAGMACATALRDGGFTGAIIIHEATNHLGGRCFSPLLPDFNRETDNGTHMFCRANRNIFKFISLLGSENEVIESKPKIKYLDYQYRKLWQFAKVSMFNTRYQRVSSVLFLKTIFKMLLNPHYCFAKNTLKDLFVTPFLKYAESHNIEIRYNNKCQKYKQGTLLLYRDQQIDLKNEKEKVVYALPLWNMRKLFTDISAIQHNPITNVHFWLTTEEHPFEFIGTLDRLGHWYKIHNDMMSVTISNTEECDLHDIWREGKEVFGLSERYRAGQILVEEKATFSQDFKNMRKRKKALKVVKKKKLLCAGDWTITNLPNSMEGACLSGFKAAKEILKNNT